MNFQQLCMTLQQFWVDKGCTYFPPYDIEVGAGTFHPATFLRSLGPEPWRAAYVQPSRRPADGRYGENPNRLYQHFQFQVVLKPAPTDIQKQYLESLEALGITVKEHDIRFDEDDWESPTLGAWGLGWQVLLDGLEITQFTYFQQMGGQDLDPITVELTYGLERIGTYIQQKDSVHDLDWDGIHTYGELYKQNEYEMSCYAFEHLDVSRERALFDSFERESERLAERGLILPAFEMCMKCSHTFNMLDAAGAISVTERARYIGRIRTMSKRCAELYVDHRQRLGFPWLTKWPAERKVHSC